MKRSHDDTDDEDRAGVGEEETVDSEVRRRAAVLDDLFPESRARGGGGRGGRGRLGFGTGLSLGGGLGRGGRSLVVGRFDPHAVAGANVEPAQAPAPVRAAPAREPATAPATASGRPPRERRRRTSSDATAASDGAPSETAPGAAAPAAAEGTSGGRFINPAFASLFKRAIDGDDAAGAEPAALSTSGWLASIGADPTADQDAAADEPASSDEASTDEPLPEESIGTELDWLQSIGATGATTKRPTALPVDTVNAAERERRAAAAVEAYRGKALPIPPFWRTESKDDIERKFQKERLALLQRIKRTSKDARRQLQRRGGGRGRAAYRR